MNHVRRPPTLTQAEYTMGDIAVLMGMPDPDRRNARDRARRRLTKMKCPLDMTTGSARAMLVDLRRLSWWQSLEEAVRARAEEGADDRERFFGRHRKAIE